MQTITENPWLRSVAVCFLAFSLVLITGCNGCRKKDPDEVAKKEEDEKKKKKRKPDFEANTPVLLPGIFPKPKLSQEELEKLRKDDPKAAAFNNPVMRANRAKLGHWYTANVQSIANNFDAKGELTAFSMDGTLRPVPIPSTDYFVSTTRPFSLPKGEWKNFETSVFVPKRDTKVAQANISYSLKRSSSGLNQFMFPQPTQAMKAFQHHILLMSNRPTSYAYLKLTDCIQLRGQTGMGEIIPPFYYIVPTNPGDPLPLPRNALAWTTIAYLFWDDYDPNILETEHQEAILDWIHFGGQLIVSGPDSLDKLQNSFLADYLPAHFDGSRNLTNEDIKDLNENWALPAKHNRAAKRSLKLSERVPLLGVTFKPHESARFVDGTGEIAIERKVGRGRIVATSFSLNSPTIRGWKSVKSFINGALLRKPPRNFGKLANEDVAFEWSGDGTTCFDPMINSTLRFLSRDLSVGGTQVTTGRIQLDSSLGQAAYQINEYEAGEEMLLKPSRSVNIDNRSRRRLDDTWHYGGFQDVDQSGLGGWNDDSGIAVAARETLKEAAGITPPNSKFVLKMLAAYLVVLVPINWLIFKTIGKVEYAWAAAPIIAIIGAFMVIRMASLDIGFVRGNTQIGLLEVHSNYSRGHLSEYSALYTSLSTRYDMELDNLTAQSLPFAVVGKNETFGSKESKSEVKLRRTTSNRLEGFQIQSNSTGLLHTEAMLNLGGMFWYSADDKGQPNNLSNSTGIDLTNACVVSRTDDGKFQFAWIGELASGGTADLEFRATEVEDLNKPWRTIAEFQNTERAGQLIWDDNADGATAVAFEQLKLFPELQSRWQVYEPLFLKLLTNKNVDPATNQQVITTQEFKLVYQRVNSASNVSLGRMLDMVVGQLKLGKGEYRLIGATDQRLGMTRFEPASTQTDQQTLVVVHLKHPELPTAERDLNAYEDFKIMSDLDQAQEMEEIEEELGKLNDEKKKKEELEAIEKKEKAKIEAEAKPKTEEAKAEAESKQNKEELSEDNSESEEKQENDK